MKLDSLLVETMNRNASDLHITVGVPPITRVSGRLVPIGNDRLNPKEIEIYVRTILDDEQFDMYRVNGEIDLSYSVPGVGRFRVNIYRQRGSDALAIRAVGLKIPTLDELNHPQVLADLSRRSRGLILVTGPTGSGKSTTLAAIIDQINKERNAHILTLEDPIEYLHKHGKSIVNQREIGHDSKTYSNALRAALREDPDVILVGEMRDLETISTAITAAETGHLVLSTVHTIGASKTIDRIVDVFPPHQQQQIKVQLAAVLEGIVSQQLIERADERGRIAALEILVVTPAIRNLIREGKTHQIDSSVQTGAKYGMKSMDMSLIELFRKGLITKEALLMCCVDKEIVSRMINI